ncbi:hypothetical protein GCM10009534_47830 [Kribbella sandramycini]
MLAILFGGLLALVLLTPFVYRSYRRRGELGFGSTLLAFSSLIYGFALVAYVLFPVPTIDDTWCAAHEALTRPQLNPFQFVHDIAKERRGFGVSAFLANPAVQQLVFNVFLFVPLGAYLRHYTKRRPVVIVLIGLGISLLIELTQLTGNWFLFECPYRLFDVDDLLTNTAGTAIGLLFAPVLRVLDHPRADVQPGTPRPVTTRRRLLGMLVDLIAVTAFGAILGVFVTLLVRGAFDVWIDDTPGGKLLGVVLTTWLPALLLLALPSLSPRQATIGQMSVRLRRARPDGRPAGPKMILALLFGSFGYFMLFGLSRYVPVAESLYQLYPVAALILAWRPRGHPGLSGVVSGLTIVDDRADIWTNSRRG